MQVQLSFSQSKNFARLSVDEAYLEIMEFITDRSKYPNIVTFINSGGELSIGYIREMNAVAFACDEGGTIWEGNSSYETFDDLLADAEEGIKKWIDQNW